MKRCGLLFAAMLPLAGCADAFLALDVASAAKDAAGAGKSSTPEPAGPAFSQHAAYCRNAVHGYPYQTGGSCAVGDVRLTPAEYRTILEERSRSQ